MTLGTSDAPLARVDVARQVLTVTCGGRVVRAYRVSTAAAGVSASAAAEMYSACGRHRIARLFGHTAAPGQVFVSRRAVKGQILPPAAWRAGGGRDYVLTRILWLEGLEPGVNRGAGIDSRARYIYIHGTNQEQLLGTPASHGCIRMANADVISFFDYAKRHRDLVVEIA